METAKGIVERPGEAAEDPLRTEFTTTNALVYVEFEGENDPMDPHNWPLGSRVLIAALTTLSTMVVTLASAIFATAIASLVRKFEVSREICLLGISLYVLGFAFGPLIWAAISEIKGRYLPLVLSLAGFVVFSFATGASNSLPSILVCRFFGGFFGAGPLTLAGPLNADLFVGRSFGIAMVSFAFVVFLGPVLSQPIGGFIVINNSLGWRWTQYLCGIMGAALLIPLALFLRESYAPVVLARKASKLRKLKGDSSILARHEAIRLSTRVIVAEYLALPVKMLFFDPIILLMCLFGSFVYALLYLFLVGYPIVFQQIHGMRPGVGGLPYLGLAVGQISSVIGIFAMQPWIMKKTRLNGGQSMPEWQLPIAIPGAVAFSVGVFWFGWSGYKRSIHWIVPTLSGWATGFGLLATFVPSITYIVQARPERPASAVAAHTMLRSLAAAAFPMFATYMYEDLGVQWASTLLGCLAASMIPIPIALYIYGPRIRERSKIVYT